MPGGVFISYRHEDSGYAGRIYDRLVSRLDRKNVFIDDNIEPGMDFFEVITQRVSACDALVAIIGKNWIADGKDGRRRLDDPDDFVRIEIEAALKRGVRVIPVLVDGANVPSPVDLPESLKGLSRRQGIEISRNGFDSDVERLTRALTLIEQERDQRGVANAATAAISGTATVAPTTAAHSATRSAEAATSSSSGVPIWAIILIVIVVLLAIWWFMTQNQKPAEPAKTGMLDAPATVESALPARHPFGGAHWASVRG